VTPSHLPPLTLAGRELLETLWTREEPMSTRQLHDAISRRYPDRAGRKINTTSTLLAELVADGWVAGERHGGRWRWRPAVTRAEGLAQLARLAVADFSENGRDAWFLVYAALGAVLPRGR
jgi:predicted transcriptional regulator